ncbi:hypothetical protein [Enterobacter cloacae complex sp. 379K3]|uniref:hypothetical protein n=1 Tax=Enterobacter cloacae complex sp. 379K3 TaxID=3395865 RepID=UPI003CF417B9
MASPGAAVGRGTLQRRWQLRFEVGVYVLAGSAGLASEGWQLLPPMDPGGMGELGVVKVSKRKAEA